MPDKKKVKEMIKNGEINKVSEQILEAASPHGAIEKSKVQDQQQSKEDKPIVPEIQSSSFDLKDESGKPIETAIKDDPEQPQAEEKEEEKDSNALPFANDVSNFNEAREAEKAALEAENQAYHYDNEEKPITISGWNDSKKPE